MQNMCYCKESKWYFVLIIAAQGQPVNFDRLQKIKSWQTRQRSENWSGIDQRSWNQATVFWTSCFLGRQHYVNGMREDSAFDKANSEIASTHIIIHCRGLWSYLFENIKES